MKQSRILISFILGLALIFGALYLYNIQKSTQLFNLHDHIFAEIEKIKTAENRIRFEVQNSVLDLYYDYGQLNALFVQIEESLGVLEEDFRNSDFKKVCRSCLSGYKELFQKKVELVEELKSQNALIKNAIMIIPSILNNHVRNIREHDLNELRDTVSLLSLILMSRNALDDDFIQRLIPLHNRLRKSYGQMLGNTAVGGRLQIQMEIFIREFPRYINTLKNIHALDTQKAYQQFITRYHEASQSQIRKITGFSYLFLGIFILSMIGTVGFLLLSNLHKSRAIKLQQALVTKAEFDALTGLPNRLKMEQDLSRLNDPALLLLDIATFSQVNNFYGKETGDRVLVQAGKLLYGFGEGMGLEENRVYRIGGDSFALLMESKPPESVKTHVQHLFETLLHEPITIDDLSVNIAFNVAFSNSLPLIDTAYQALNLVKDSSRERFIIYEPGLIDHKEIKENLQIARELSSAMEQDRVILHYQPIYDNLSDKIQKYEALVRYMDEQEKIVYPGAFLDVAKESKLIGPLTQRVIHLAIQKLKSTDCHLSLNLSTEDIHDPRIFQAILKMLRASPTLAKRLTFEILESEGGMFDDTAQAFLAELQEMGAEIAIDDFGSGFSNYGRILELNINLLKIDGSLIKQIDTDTRSQKIVEGIIHFAKGMGIKTVAEFVHSEAVHQKVKQLGIDYSQGFYLGKPLDKIEGC